MQELHVVELAAGPSGDSGGTGGHSPSLLVADEAGTTARLRIDERLFAAVDAARGVQAAAPDEPDGPDGPADSEGTSSKTTSSKTTSSMTSSMTTSSMTTEAEMSDETRGDQASSPVTGRPDGRPSGAVHGSAGRREDPPLRPRDIQVRIRAGETAEEIATAANVPLADIQRFEGPVLAERVWMAQRARAVVPRRGEGATTSMGELATERLGSRGVSELDQDWDSWRREDGTWTVRLSWAEGNRGRLACWRFDPVRQTVVAVDEAARELTDPPAPRRLSAVPGEPSRVGPGTPAEAATAARDRVYDLEADGGLHVVGGTSRRLQVPEDAEASQRSAWPRAAADADPATTLWDDESPEQGQHQEAEATAGRENAAVTEATELPGSAPDAGASPATVDAATQPTELGEQAGRGEAERREQSERSEQGSSEQGSSEPSKRKKRASVPSWDDILLGSRRSQ